jgi:hypothetical protein
VRPPPPPRTLVHLPPPPPPCRPAAPPPPLVAGRSGQGLPAPACPASLQPLLQLSSAQLSSAGVAARCGAVATRYSRLMGAEEVDQQAGHGVQRGHTESVAGGSGGGGGAGLAAGGGAAAAAAAHSVPSAWCTLMKGDWSHPELAHARRRIVEEAAAPPPRPCCCRRALCCAAQGLCKLLCCLGALIRRIVCCEIGCCGPKASEVSNRMRGVSQSVSPRRRAVLAMECVTPCSPSLPTPARQRCIYINSCCPLARPSPPGGGGAAAAPARGGRGASLARDTAHGAGRCASETGERERGEGGAATTSPPEQLCSRQQRALSRSRPSRPAPHGPVLPVLVNLC